MREALTGFCIVFYSAVFELARRLAGPCANGIGRKKGWNLDERQKIPHIVSGLDRCSRTAVWVHAASLGEAKLLQQFLGMLHARNPGDCYVVTATTRSGVEYLERMKSRSVAAVGFLPLDTLPLMKSLIRNFRISRLWLLETELWPAMLWACFTEGIPVGIANARIEEKSFANYRRLGLVVRPLLRRLDVVLAQNETYAQRFLSLGVRPETLHVVGNMKGYIRIGRPSAAERLARRRSMHLAESDIVITAGCLHRGEGGVLRRCLDELSRRGRRCKCIVVPRYLEESEEIAGELGSSVLRLSEAGTAAAWDTCIVEKMGILETMYRIADAAIVGGTFVNIGGHNVWEPARFGIPVFFGPDCQTQNSSCEKLLTFGVGCKVSSGEELAGGLERTLWIDPQKFAAAERIFAEYSNQQQRVIEPLIP